MSSGWPSTSGGHSLARQRENVAPAPRRRRGGTPGRQRSGLELLRHLPGMPDIAIRRPGHVQPRVAPAPVHARRTSPARSVSPLTFASIAAQSRHAGFADRLRPGTCRYPARFGESRPVSGWIRYGPLSQPLATILEPVRDSAGLLRYYLAIEAELDWFNRPGGCDPERTRRDGRYRRLDRLHHCATTRWRTLRGNAISPRTARCST